MVCSLIKTFESSFVVEIVEEDRNENITNILIMSTSIQQTHRALVQHVYAEPFVFEDVPTPQATPGSAILCVEAAPVFSYQRDIYNGHRQYPYPTPMVPGSGAIGRAVAVGPDAVVLRPGTLVFFDCFIRARDDASVAILSGVSDGGHPGARKLMSGEWRDSSFCAAHQSAAGELSHSG